MKVLIYCTKAKPWLNKVPLFGGNKKEYCLSKGRKPSSLVLNGFVCFECDCKEAIKLMYWCYNIEESDAGFYGDNKDGEMFCNRNFKRLGLAKDDISTNDKLFEYGKGKDLYAYHFENVKPIDPMPITKLYKDAACTKSLTRSPQSYCFAYQRLDGYANPWDIFSKEPVAPVFYDKFGVPYRSRKVLVFSIQSPWVCKIANGTKDLEVRKTRIQNAGIEYK